MSIENDEQLDNTRRKLDLLDKQIDIARARPHTDANVASLRSLVQTANQMREEIVRYRGRQKRQAS